MQKDVFEKRFDEAVKRILDRTREFIVEEIPNKCLYVIETVDYKKTQPITKDEAIGIMFKDGKVPRWVDLGVIDIQDDTTIVQCVIAPDYFEEDEYLLYEEEGLPPFKVPLNAKSEHNKTDKKISLKELRSDL
ncbi:MAG: hypothetical protein AAB590_03045 [Patescibacteria group bacterium]